MRIIKSVKSDSTEQYFNAESFLKIYLTKASSITYIVCAEFSSNDTIQLNTTPIYLPKATNLLHKFLGLLLNSDVKMIAVDARGVGKVDRAIYIDRNLY